MQRLTEKEPYWLGEEFWTSAKEPDEAEIDAVYEKLKTYEDLEEQGLLLRLPVKIGDTVYTSIHGSGWYFREKDKPYEAEIVFIGINASEPFMNIEYKKGYMLSFKLSEIGERIFLTKEEAEAKLREMEE